MWNQNSTYSTGSNGGCIGEGAVLPGNCWEFPGGPANAIQRLGNGGKLACA
jgi:hypothetical protein